MLSNYQVMLTDKESDALAALADEHGLLPEEFLRGLFVLIFVRRDPMFEPLMDSILTHLTTRTQ